MNNLSEINQIKTNTNLLKKLITVCGKKNVFTQDSILQDYGRDETQDFSFKFEYLVKPANEREISEIVKICSQYQIPLTPRGGGSGVTGGALPIKGGVVLSLERLNKILEINVLDGYVVAESGVITDNLCKGVEEQGLFFPVAPSSRAISFIGGNIAENAGSINSCKYGNTAQYVLNLEVILPNGEIIWTGANVSKNATGYNLTQLIVGSEGTLGIVTKVVYKLIKTPSLDVSLLAGFSSLKYAYDCIVALKQSAIQPSACELICEEAIQLVVSNLPKAYPLVKEGVKAHLLISLKANRKEEILFQMEELEILLKKFTQEEILLADNSSDKQKLWDLRFNIGNALTSNGRIYRDIDVSTPVTYLYDYLVKIERICSDKGVPCIRFGHALDGNMHCMISLKKDIGPENEKIIDSIVSEIYSFAIKKGGVISGEHGIGMLQNKFMKLQFSPSHLQLMKDIKNLFDPQEILNSGKIF